MSLYLDVYVEGSNSVGLMTWFLQSNGNGLYLNIRIISFLVTRFYFLRQIEQKVTLFYLCFIHE